jgi:hypothetical protein
VAALLHSCGPQRPGTRATAVRRAAPRPSGGRGGVRGARGDRAELESDTTILLLGSNEFHGSEGEPYPTGSKLLYVVMTRANELVHGRR